MTFPNRSSITIPMSKKSKKVDDIRDKILNKKVHTQEINFDGSAKSSFA